MSKTGEGLDVKESWRLGVPVLCRGQGDVYERPDPKCDTSGESEERLFISNVMSSIAQGTTGASERERRLAERIANKYRYEANIQE